METLTLRTFTNRIADDSAFRKRVARSSSPGGTAAQLGISRQRVHQLVQAGRLGGLRIVDDKGTVVISLIYAESIERRLEHRAA